jgi:predicted Zn-dependent protease
MLFSFMREVGVLSLLGLSRCSPETSHLKPEIYQSMPDTWHLTPSDKPLERTPACHYDVTQPSEWRWLRMRPLILVLSILLLAAAATAADREAAKASYRQGNEFFDQDRFADASAAYGRAIEQDPQFLEAYYNRALADEMVDRQKAIADWHQFSDLAASAPDFKYQIGQANARIQILGMLPVHPDALQPSHYVPSASDYYLEIAETSESERWNSFPIKVSIGNVPEANWAQGAREAFSIWKEMLPLELTAEPDEADIRFNWEADQTMERGAVGEEMDWVQFRRVGGELTGRKVAFISVDLSRRWSKDEMRAIVLHEMGHALGIRGHSSSKGDIMYFQVQEKNRQVRVPGLYYPFVWKTLVSKPSQRDLNTLIRLYNTPGVVQRER